MHRRHWSVGVGLLACLGGLLMQPHPCGAEDTAPSSPLNAPAETAQSGGTLDHFQISDFFARHALDLAPTRVAFSLDFPLQLVRRVLWDTGYLLTAPGRWDRSDWTQFSLVAAGTAGVMGLDREIDVQSRINHPRGNRERHFENSLEALAELPGIAGVVGGSAIVGLLAKSDRLTRLAVDMSESLLIAEPIFTGALKKAAGRSRPRADKGTFHFTPFAGGASLPSGHAATAFAMAASIAEEFDNNLWVAVPAYALATGVGVARIRADAHFASDVLLGALIGTFTARTIVRLERERMRRAGPRGQATVELTPVVGRDVRGIELTLRF
jgi:membrane-associated phospholipid phosphatase